MKSFLLPPTLLLFSSLAMAQQPARSGQPASNRTPPAAQASDSTILLDESANLKSDLAELRSLLNVLASQESGTDPRSFGVIQTNRQMWQVIIARLAELTQRLDAIEQRQRSGTTAPAQAPKH